MAEPKGGHKLRPVRSRKHRKVHLRMDCDKCGRFECVTVYEDQVEAIKFKLNFFQCKQCRRSFCHICIADDDDISCPFCGKRKPKTVKPFDVYVCGVCFREWWNEGGLCIECDHIEKPEPDPDKGKYKGPVED
ncbi:MAG: hypothetical protein KKD39_01545 [Candidatus Altiarchaeota archaeon]|nr:hypothetical protein [Candidatus Altiarchaeota archaeon]